MKGGPNLTLYYVVSWIKDKYAVEVCRSTVCHWLHNLGFSSEFSKGVFFDGHERPDVVADRELIWKPCTCSTEGCGSIILSH